MARIVSPHRLLAMALVASCLLAAVAGGQELAAPTVTGSDEASWETLRIFLKWSANARSHEMDAAARRFNVAQVPLAAAAADRAERSGVVPSSSSYRALTRWHFWMGKRLDSSNRGYWEAHPAWMPIPAAYGRHTAATLPALEMLHLQSLGSMAYRRGQIFDALVWWRDRGLLERRMARHLFDPTTGGFARVDSLGRRQNHPADLSDLTPLALGAPSDRASARLLAQTYLGGGKFTGVDDRDALATVRLRLDPSTGWPYRPGLHLLSPEQNALLIDQAVGSLGHADLSELTSETLERFGFDLSGPMILDLDGRRVPVPAHPPRLEPLARSHVAVEFLFRTAVLTADQALAAHADLDHAADELPEGADETADALEARLDEWATIEPSFSRARQGRATPIPSANGDPKTAVFGYRRESADSWIGEALGLLQQDALQLRTASSPGASYRARIEPRAVARDQAPTAHVHFTDTSLARRAAETDWNVRWTDGRLRLPVTRSPLVLSSALDGELVLPSPPAEPGLWWLILRGPAGRPADAPAIAVVDPLKASVASLSTDESHFTHEFEIAVDNQLVGALRGRIEVVPPVGWDVVPAMDIPFELAGRQSRLWPVTIQAPDGQAPGLYPLEWRFYDGMEMVSRLSSHIALHFQWVAIGPFPGSSNRSLAPTYGPDRSIQLGARYGSSDEQLAWAHVGAEKLSADGWVTLGRGEPGSLWYGLTAVSTTSRDVLLDLEGGGATLLKVNGEEICRDLPEGSSDSGSASLTGGPNYLVVKSVADDSGVARFRFGIQDITGRPLSSAEYALDQLLDGFAYVDGPAASAEPTPEELQRVQMRLVPITYHNGAAMKVAVVGSFNGWSPDLTPMYKGDAGEWRCEIRLRPGRFEYKLVVDDQRWISDPANPLAVDDGFGSRNSVLVIE